MVDFNNEATIGTPAVNVVKILLLQARANAIEALEFFNKKTSQGVQADQAVLKARLGTWFLEHQAFLKRSLKGENYEKIKGKFNENIFFNQADLKNEILLEIITDLNEIMDDLRITRVDTKRKYDKSDIEEDNKQNDLG